MLGKKKKKDAEPKAKEEKKEPKVEKAPEPPKKEEVSSSANSPYQPPEKGRVILKEELTRSRFIVAEDGKVLTVHAQLLRSSGKILLTKFDTKEICAAEDYETGSWRQPEELEALKTSLVDRAKKEAEEAQDAAKKARLIRARKKAEALAKEKAESEKKKEEAKSKTKEEVDKKAEADKKAAAKEKADKIKADSKKKKS